MVGYQPAMQYLKNRNKVEWETVTPTSGDMTQYVNSTGTVRPVQSVLVGSVVSGPIVELNVDFNDQVSEGDVLARIDPRLYKADVERDKATLATRVAEVERVKAQLQQAVNNFERGKELRANGKAFVSENEMDSLTFEVKSVTAQLKLANATVLQAQASLENSVANLTYCDIKSPVDGVVIDRKIDPGQTLAASFQTPELFIVAPDLREKVHVFASVDEADIGLIQKAKQESRPVTFTVDAHPDELFQGEIEQIRVSSETTQNVVTYPVVIAAANPDLKLLPGMTTSISFEVDSVKDAKRIPNTALRFFPDDVGLVREVDKKLIDGSNWKTDQDDNEKEEIELAAGERARARRNRSKRHVWAMENDQLKAIEIQIGLSESGFTEVKSGELSENDALITGKKS